MGAESSLGKDLLHYWELDHPAGPTIVCRRIHLMCQATCAFASRAGERVSAISGALFGESKAFVPVKPYELPFVPVLLHTSMSRKSFDHTQGSFEYLRYSFGIAWEFWELFGSCFCIID